MEYRVGAGYDIHRCSPAEELRLGGVDVPAEFGLAGHSDADVLCHAVIDAVLGALALGDIGQWFPPDDPAWQDACSLRLLESVLADDSVSAWNLINMDATIIAQAPRLGPFTESIRRSLAAVLEVGTDRVSVKATTHERLGSLGAGEGIAAHAVVLLSSDRV